MIGKVKLGKWQSNQTVVTGLMANANGMVQRSRAAEGYEIIVMEGSLYDTLIGLGWDGCQDLPFKDQAMRLNLELGSGDGREIALS